MATINGFGQAADSVQQLSARVQQLARHDGRHPEGAARPGPGQHSRSSCRTPPAPSSRCRRPPRTWTRLATEFKKTAVEFRKTRRDHERLERLNQGGVVDKLAEGAGAMATAGNSFNTGTLPRLNRTSDEAARTARQVNRAVNAVSDNPQSLLFGNGPIPPDRVESPDFSFPKGTP
jgi:X-X-X-Leu-X-X-Gly heptad repeat protein